MIVDIADIVDIANILDIADIADVLEQKIVSSHFFVRKKLN